ncbi:MULTISPECIES: hypothetical protein [Staphylococcus]|jgi:hypothetical protein|uniref:Uncharacterized protein n=1 Tax=Bacillus anthracis TaxID=1392 RepID=A0A640MZ01_BACAN|nr:MULTISPECIES: hypothetical protein [Staphylococcus]GEU19387.1 hypothetical protein LamDB_49860 [Bacillus anthracis]HDN2212162.1 hypothetical protein [Staphylococcus aureus]EZI32608.1 hypothetical protein BW32_02045 [Staphylococcus haemolyticus]MBC3012901.1 hypothetical protein [Staphylococcus haemolyticus]MBC3103629.1 hypothetical protein [Staphylococcus haemolyticus]
MQNLTNAETKNVNGGNKFTDAVNATKDWFGRVGKGADKAHEDNGWP